MGKHGLATTILVIDRIPPTGWTPFGQSTRSPNGNN